MRPRKLELPRRFEPKFRSPQLSVFGATPAVIVILREVKNFT